ncbi:MAG TPA: hypothetical protein DDX98_00885 [Bacteroidales bacterium]|jgi:arsenite methyltransferase|nr:hypothetical protein [Bacteroidales bacterium]
MIDLNTDYNLDSHQLIEVLDEVPLWSAPFGIRLLESVFYKKNITGLDIGFGCGFPLTELALRFGKTCKIYGIDPWEAATKRVRKKLEIYGIKNVEIIQGKAEEIPLETNSVDLITSNNGINNVADLDKAISECSRVLKSGGQFVQTINLNTTMYQFYDHLEEVLRENKLDVHTDKIKEQIHGKRRPLHEFTDVLKNHSFMEENVSHDIFDYRFVDGTALFQHYFMRLAFLDGWKSIIPEKMQQHVFNCMEDKLNRKAEKDGFIKLTIPFVVINCIRK